MTRLAGLTIGICQMLVVPGRPDINGQYIIEQIGQAIKQGCDIVVFPEMCITGYLIGDLYDDECFIKDAQMWNERIRTVTQGITAIFGSVTSDQKKRGENGALRKFNTALVAQNGQWRGQAIKTLQPNYRIFNDDRHFYSLRKLYEEQLQIDYAQDNTPSSLADLYKPIMIDTKIGQVALGLTLCEDMWHQDYNYNPTKYLVEQGAELILNLSASPWTWHKQRKRHKVIQELLKENSVPFVYVNNIGIQNSGKNIIVFDGSSAVYEPGGEIVFQAPAYTKGLSVLTLTDKMANIPLLESEDTAQLYQAIRFALEGYFQTLAPNRRKIIVGLSGGIDSAVSLALYVDVLGKENVLAINMPSRYNSSETQAIAAQIAENLGVSYEIKPIQPIVDLIATTTGSQPDTPGYENIQARVRMEILAARAQDWGGVFSSNWNKVEAAFGYGTLYGDMAGFIAAIGDLVKREVYQLADYLNREIYKFPVIPVSCLEIAPTAELRGGQQDPFDYGHVDQRGYHDEMVRAFTEFRRNPEWFLQQYAQGRLETELKLEPGRLKKLFPSTREFIKDLEKRWQQFYGAYFKRVQSVPVPMLSKRAYGTDLQESILSPHLTQRYKDIKKILLNQDRPAQRIAVLGGSFNPVALHHQRIAEYLTKRFDLVLIVPCGVRTDKPSVQAVPAFHRKEMLNLAFTSMNKIEIDHYDLDNNCYTPNYFLAQRYRSRFPKAEIWYVVGGDIVTGGRQQQSEIHRIWRYGAEVWQELNFLVLTRGGYPLESADLPPSSELLQIDHLYGSATMVRSRLQAQQSIDDLVCPAVAAYIKAQSLYQ